MKRGNVIWFLASFGLSFGANHTLKATLDYAPFLEGHTLPSGEMMLSGDANVAIKLVDIRVVAVDVQSPVGRTLEVRTLLVRSALGDEQLEPDLELFVDFRMPDGAPIDLTARSIEVLRGRALPILPVAEASESASRVRLPGSEGTAVVHRGTFTISDALQIAPGDWRIRGDLDMELIDAGEQRAAMARVTGKLIWE